MNPHLEYIIKELTNLANECNCRAEHGAEPKDVLETIGKNIYKLADLVECLDNYIPQEKKDLSFL